MGATFPNGIASFKQHRDLLDDIDAADINKIQDEVTALEETLGDTLTTLQIIQSEVEVLDNEVLGLEQNDQQTLIKFKNLKDLITALWNGKNIDAAEAEAHNFMIANTPADRPYVPDLIKLEKPSAENDPGGMWNGTGFTIPTSGFYVAMGMVDWQLASISPTDNRNFGTYEATVTRNGTTFFGTLDRDYPMVDEHWHDVILHPNYIGWLGKGERLTLRAAQSSKLAQNVATARLSVFRVRTR